VEREGRLEKCGKAPHRELASARLAFQREEILGLVPWHGGGSQSGTFRIAKKSGNVEEDHGSLLSDGTEREGEGKKTGDQTPRKQGRSLNARRRPAHGVRKKCAVF